MKGGGWTHYYSEAVEEGGDGGAGTCRTGGGPCLSGRKWEVSDKRWIYAQLPGTGEGRKARLPRADGRWAAFNRMSDNGVPRRLTKSLQRFQWQGLFCCGPPFVLHRCGRVGLVSGAGRLPLSASDKYTASKRSAFAHALWACLIFRPAFSSRCQKKGLPVRVC